MFFWIFIALLAVAPILVGVTTHSDENGFGTFFGILVVGGGFLLVASLVVPEDIEVSRETKTLSKLTNTRGEEGYAFTKIEGGGAITHFKDEDGYHSGSLTVLEKEGTDVGTVETVTYINDFKWLFSWDGSTSQKLTLTIPQGSLGGM